MSVCVYVYFLIYTFLHTLYMYLYLLSPQYISGSPLGPEILCMNPLRFLASDEGFMIVI